MLDSSLLARSCDHARNSHACVLMCIGSDVGIDVDIDIDVGADVVVMWVFAAAAVTTTNRMHQITSITTVLQGGD